MDPRTSGLVDSELQTRKLSQGFFSLTMLLYTLRRFRDKKRTEKTLLITSTTRCKLFAVGFRSTTVRYVAQTKGEVKSEPKIKSNHNLHLYS